MITLGAPAKLTWTLEITGRRDAGLHELRCEMTTLSLHDRLVIDESADYLKVFSPFVAPVLADEANLVARALRVVQRRAGVTIEKRIPVGGGLGGGSADAAAILRWAGGVADEVALALGSDVPFCQRGGRALVEGCGERLTPLDFQARDVTLFMTEFAVSTANCYRAYDELRDGGWSPGGLNHLEEPAGVVEPRLRASLAWLRAEYGDDVQLAGSGSTMFLGRHLAPEAPRRVEGPAGPIQVLQTTTTPT